MYKLIELVVAHKPSARNVMHYHFRWKWVLTQRHNDTTSQTQTQIHKYTNTQRNKRRKKSTHDEQEKEAKHNKEKLVSILLCVCLFFGIIPFRYVTWYFFSVCYHLSRSIFISNTSDVNKRHCEQLFKAKGFLVFHNNCEPLSSFFHALCSLLALSRSVISYVSVFVMVVVISMITETIFRNRATKGGTLVSWTMWCIWTIFYTLQNMLDIVLDANIGSIFFRFIFAHWQPITLNIASYIELDKNLNIIEMLQIICTVRLLPKVWNTYTFALAMRKKSIYIHYIEIDTSVSSAGIWRISLLNHF